MGVVKWVGHAHNQVGQSTIHTSRQTYLILSFFAQGVQILEDFEVLSMIFWPICIARKRLKISKSSKIWTLWGKMLKMKYVSLEVCIVDWPTWLWAWPTHMVTPIVESTPLTVLIYVVIKNTFKHDCKFYRFYPHRIKKYSDMLNMKALVGIRIIFMGKEFWMMSVLVVLYKKGIYISMEYMQK